MERRNFLKNMGYSLLLGAAAVLGVGAKSVQALTRDPGLIAQDDLPKGCQNKSAKGLTRCKGHTGSCEGSHHVCSSHSTGKGPKKGSCGQGKTFQCKDHGN